VKSTLLKTAVVLYEVSRSKRRIGSFWKKDEPTPKARETFAPTFTSSEKVMSVAKGSMNDGVYIHYGLG
jgi:hypothetical protein